MTIHVGDCREVMATMDADSVDAVVTDPPYGLEFMGKEWDNLATQPNHRLRPNKAMGAAPDTEKGNPWASERPSYGAPKKNPVCTNCGRHRLSGTPCVCPDPRWDTRTREYAKTMQDWHETWAREAFRVLKPGGHLLAFSGTRTSHRMVCAIEDAGFEIRDSIVWMYGSGFPKSLDVGKAMDKRNGSPLAWITFADAYADAVKQSPYNHSDIDKALGLQPGGSSCYWARKDHRGGMPPRHHWDAVRSLLSLDDALEDLYAEAEREVVGSRDVPIGHAFAGPTYGGDSSSQIVDITAPATDLARQWDGWGTSLKPAHEPVVVARKPWSIEQERGIIVANLLRLGAQLWSLLPASAAAEIFGSSQADYDAAFASAQWTADERRNTQDALSDLMDTSQFGSAMTTSWNIVQSWQSTLGDLLNETSTSITETRFDQRTDWTTLRSYVSDLTPVTIIRAAMQVDGLTLNALPAARFFRAAWLNLLATHELSALASATSQGQPNSPAEGARRPAHEPIVVARKPLIGTVAANVERYGCGALNIDASRIHSAGSEAKAYTVKRLKPGATLNKTGGNWRPEEGGIEYHGETTAGRWPANILLSHSPMCREVGTKRVKGSHHNGKPIPRNVGGQYGGGFTGGGSGKSTTDADGMETVTAWECVEGCPVAMLDAQSGERGGGRASGPDHRPSRSKNGYGPGDEDGWSGTWHRSGAHYGDSGSAARFFLNVSWQPGELDEAMRFKYCAKSSRRERNSGLDGIRTVKYNVSSVGGASLCEATVTLLQKATSDIPTVKWLIGESGVSIMGQCPRDSLSTTLTAIRQITTSLTSPSWMLSPISDFIVDANSETANGGSLAELAESSNGLMWISTNGQTESLPSANDAAVAVLLRTSNEDDWQPLTNIHSTVKPVALMRYLVKLVVPPNGVVMDCFAGSGTTGIAACLEGVNFIGIEQDPEYASIAAHRIAHVVTHGERWLDAAKAATYGGPRRYGGGKGYGDTVRRCPEHDASFPSGSNRYSCGCPAVRVPAMDVSRDEPRPTVPSTDTPTLTDLPLFALVAD